MLVRKFYEPGRKAIAAYFGIQYCDTGPIVNQALEKIIIKVASIRLTSEGEFSSYVNKVIFNTAYDYLRKKQNEKERIRFDPFFTDSNYRVNDADKDDNSEFFIDDDLESISEDLNDEEMEKEFDIAKATAEIDFFCDTDTINSNERSKFINELFDSFSSDDGCFLRLHLNAVKHDEIARMRGSTPAATRKYINRLLKKFLMLASKKININFHKIYENYKRQNKKADSE